jgi:hypothetical protein
LRKVQDKCGRLKLQVDHAQATLGLSGHVAVCESKKQDLKNAQYASARALLLARGAHARMPDEKATKIEVKLSEAMRALVRAYEAGVKDDLDNVVKHSNDAWYLADQAAKIAGSNIQSSVDINVMFIRC